MQEDLILIQFKVTDEFYGYPDPYMPTGTIVILIQDGKISISKYHEPTVEEPFPSFSHPDPNLSKNIEIEQKLYDLIQEKHPQYLNSEDSVVVLCPGKYLPEIVW
ncbi:MAG TPA: hypothetical protein VIM79_02365 [Niastella sp.]